MKPLRFLEFGKDFLWSEISRLSLWQFDRFTFETEIVPQAFSDATSGEDLKIVLPSFETKSGREEEIWFDDDHFDWE